MSRKGDCPFGHSRWSPPYTSVLVGLNDPLVRRCLDCGYIEHLGRAGTIHG